MPFTEASKCECGTPGPPACLMAARTPPRRHRQPALAASEPSVSSALRAALSSWPVEQRADLLHEAFRQARLQDEGVTPCRDGVDSAVTLNAPGAGDDGDVSRAAVLLQPPDRLPPVDLRQRQVHDDHVWLSAKCCADRRRAIAGQDVAEALRGEVHRVHLAGVRVIVHDEDERRRAAVHLPHERTFTLGCFFDNPQIYLGNHFLFASSSRCPIIRVMEQSTWPVCPVCKAPVKPTEPVGASTADDRVVHLRCWVWGRLGALPSPARPSATT